MKHLSHNILQSIPLLFIGMRFLLGPLLLWVALDCRSMSTGCPWFIVGFTAAFLSDVFDGVVARRLGIVTEKLREYDGWVDTWFYIWVALSAWFTHTDAIIAFRFPLLVVLSTQLISWCIDLIKYRRFANYHAYSSKAWGVTLFVACIALFGFNYAELLWLTIVVGILSHIEEMAMSLVLPRWIHDVPSVVHALRIRQQMLTNVEQ